MRQAQAGLAELIGRTPVIPVLTIDDLELAVPLGKALVAGGLNVLEITLRTPVALQSMQRIAGEVEGAICGAGTVLNAMQLRAAELAKAQFAVSPGATSALIAAAGQSPIPLLPGVATASEAMNLMEEGILLQKFFPAEASGGPEALAALSAPLPMLRFCPTGGIDQAKASAYLALGNVFAVGGSWMAPKVMIANQDWAEVTRLATAAAGLRDRG
ncbi:MAG: bifunctional 4-hydroxy-2-oxoglutarate aldolase/2-dehydro-3-deoxy-phosphogluconate aldolase [Hyphomicrobiaceae bacterium]